VLSFDDQTRQLRDPLSLFKNLPALAGRYRVHSQHSASPGFGSGCALLVAERIRTDLLFLAAGSSHGRLSATGVAVAWREEWLQVAIISGAISKKRTAGILGAPVQSKQQYLGSWKSLLQRAAQIPSCRDAYGKRIHLR